MEKDTTLKTTDAGSETAVPMPDAPQTTSHASSYSTEHGSGCNKCDASSFRDLEAALPADASSITQTGDGGDKVPAQYISSLKIHPEDSADSPLGGAAHADDKHHSVIDIEPAKESQFKSTDHMKKDELPVEESKSSIDNTETLSEPVGLRRRRSSRVEFQKPSTQDGGRQTPEDEKSNVLPVSGAAQKSAERKGSKQLKAKGIVEKESSSATCAKVVGKKGVESPSIEDLRDMEPPDRKVHESFIRQTMGAREQWEKPYVSSYPRHGDKPIQRMIENQQAARSLKSLRVDVEGQDDSTNMDHLQADLERDSFLTGTKGVGSLGKGLHGDRHLQALKSSIPQASPAFAKNSDLPGWPLLSPSKVQLQKCDKCLREFCSLLNLRRHIRTHRRISHADKEDLDLKRTEVAAFWDKLNDKEAQQILSSSKSIDPEDQSGKMVVDRLIEFLSQGSPTPLPTAYLKAGQDLLELMDNRQGVVSLHSSRLLSILDEASERTFLSNELKGDASKDVLDDKNLVASLSIIFEQSLVKAWMADKESEALRNQQELVKEEEAAQMKRERTVAKKKKKKEKSRQKGLKDRKTGAPTCVLNEENESVDDGNPSPEIVEEDNSPTASSTSLNSSAHDNPLLLESQEPEVIDQSQAEGRDQAILGEGDQPPKPNDTSSVLTKDHASDAAHGNRGKQIHSDLGSTDREREQPMVISSPAQSKLDDDKAEQEHNALEYRKYEPGSQAKEVPRVDYQERGGVSDPRYQEGPQQSSYRTVRRPSSGISYSSRSECGSSPVPGFYRGKPTVNRGAMPFQATQQWAKKTHPPALVDNTKEGEEDGDGERDDTSTIKTRVKESSLELTLARELDADQGLSNSRIAKEEIRSIDRKEPLPLPMTSTAKIVASTGGIGSLSSLPFSLDGNPEDWPPLSGSKNAGPSTLATVHSDVDARALQKASTEKPGGHLGLEAKVEGSHVRAPSAARSVVKSGGEAETANSLMVGQLPVPLDYGNMTGSGSGIGSNKSSSFLSSQSYTAAVGVPQARPTQDFNANSGSGQRLNEAPINPEFEDTSGIQVGDGSAVANQYRSSSFRPTVSSALLKNIRGPVYPTIERAPLTRQPSWSSNTVRYPPQKVWRPVRPTGENVDPVLGGGTGTDGSSTGFYERDTVETAGSEEGATDLNAVGVGNFHVGDDKNRFAKADSSSQCKTSEDVLPGSSHLDYTRDSSINYVFGVVEPGKSQYDLHGGSKFAEDNRVECSIGAPISRVNIEQANPHARDISAGEPDMENLQETVNRKSDEEFDKESTPALWAAKVVELHKQRWKDANMNPDTVTHKDNQERPELQTTVWDEFLASMEEGIAVLQIADSSIASDGSGQIGGQSLSNKVDDQAMDIQGCGQKSCGDLPAHITDKGALPATTLMECERQVSRGDT